jgi:hypothetical protein
VQRYLRAIGDARTLVADPKAGYFGAELNDQSLTPAGQARIGSIPFDTWLAQSKATQPASR